MVSFHAPGVDPSVIAHLSPTEQSRLWEAASAVSSEKVEALVADIFSQTPFTSPFWADHGCSSREWPIVALSAYAQQRIPKTIFVT